MTRRQKMLGRLMSDWSCLCARWPMAGCNSEPTPTPAPVMTPLPDIGLIGSGGTVRASGNIEPAQEAELAFPREGRVQSVAVEVGRQRGERRRPHHVGGGDRRGRRGSGPVGAL